MKASDRAKLQYWTDVESAAKEFNSRKSRASHPDGKTDNGGRWYPDETERRECCNCVREPSRAFPWSLMHHCRTAKHIANLYNVEYGDLLETAKELQSEY